MSKSVTKTVLKARMLELFREIERTGEPLVVTSHGRPVLKVVPVEGVESVASLFGDVRGKIELPSDADLTSPVPAEAFSDSDIEDLIAS